jgi:hypothetical protein
MLSNGMTVFASTALAIQMADATAGVLPNGDV